MNNAGLSTTMRKCKGSFSFFLERLKMTKKNHWYMFAIGFLILFLACLCSSNANNSDSSSSEPTSQIPTNTVESRGMPSLTPDQGTVTVEALLTQAAAAQTEAFKPEQTEPTDTPPGVPGLQPVDIILPLEEDLGFTCSDLEIWEPTEFFPETIYYHSCELDTIEAHIFIEIHGTSLFTIDNIQANVSEFGLPYDEIAIPFLGYIASIPYDGAEPDSARAWVEKTIPTIFENGDLREAEFGGIPFLLAGAPGARLLIIGPDY